MGYRVYKIRYLSLLWGLLLVIAIGTRSAFAQPPVPALVETPKARPLPDCTTEPAYTPATTDLAVPPCSFKKITERGEELLAASLLVQPFQWLLTLLTFNRIHYYFSSLRYVFGYYIAINAP